MENKKPVVYLAAWLIEHDQAERVRLIEELERLKQAGEDGAGEWRGWKAFALYFADHYPIVAVFFPFAVCLYLFTFFQIVGGWPWP